MLYIHPNARTTPAIRAEIGRKWRDRGVNDCLDRSRRLPCKATEDERPMIRIPVDQFG